MRTINIYEFDELSDEAKQNTKDDDYFIIDIAEQIVSIANSVSYSLNYEKESMDSMRNILIQNLSIRFNKPFHLNEYCDFIDGLMNIITNKCNPYKIYDFIRDDFWSVDSKITNHKEYLSNNYTEFFENGVRYTLCY